MNTRQSAYDKFEMKLYDNNAGIDTYQKQYNGNIAWVNWATNRDQVKSVYVYKYDP